MSKTTESDAYDDPRLSALYRRTRNVAPVPELDRNLLALARHQAARRRRKWLIPVSSAAAALLGLSLALQVFDLEEQVRETDSATDADAEYSDSSAPEDGRKAATPAPAPAAAPQPLRREPERPRRSVEEAPRQRLSAPAEKARRAAPGFAAEPDVANPDETPEPAHWLAQIRRLMNAGEFPAARSELERLQDRYPDYPIPEDVATLSER